MRTVGQVAELTGVTVRTLHHYDEEGLVRPGARSAAGYRLYDDADVALLARVVVLRRLGLSLEQVRKALDGDRLAQLRTARAAVERRRQELDGLAQALDRAIEEGVMTDLQDEAWAAEAEERWGSSDAWAQSRRRTSAYTAEDWAAIKAEQRALNERFATALVAGEPTDGPVARQVALDHRAHLTRWFYDCTPELHAALGEMYVADERFAATYEALVPGLARYVRDAVAAA